MANAVQYTRSLLVSELNEEPFIYGSNMLPMPAKAKAIKLLFFILSTRDKDYIISIWIHFQSSSDSQFCFSSSLYIDYGLFYTSTIQKNFLWCWKYVILFLSSMVATGHLYQLSIWNVAYETKEQNFNRFHLNRHVWLP